MSFRRSQAFPVTEQNTALWLRLIERDAQHLDVPPLRDAALRKTARALPAIVVINMTN